MTEPAAAQACSSLHPALPPDPFPSVDDTPPASRARVLLLGATGTIGRATVAALLEQGHEVVAFARQRPAGPQALQAPHTARLQWRTGDLLDPASLARDGVRGERFDVLMSCLASRTGVPRDAWAIDHQAHVQALQAALGAGVTQVVLLSAICVQKPRLAFQQAKLAFERALVDCGVDYSIVRPTAFFKSLSGQVERVRRGKPFLVFGDGRLTACKPISDADLARYLVGCVGNPLRRNRVLPIGGPGPAVTPREQAAMLSALLGRPVALRSVPLGLLDTIIAGLSLAGRLMPRLADKAELARIGRYYASESMLVLDPATGRYDATATPETGSDTLLEHYRQLLRGEVVAERGEHAVF